MKVTVRIEGHTYLVDIGNLDTNPVIAVVDGQSFEVWQDHPVNSPLSPSTNSNGSHNYQSQNVLAPIPGVIIAVSVREGQQVEAGQEVCVLEAMKMKQSIRSAREGKVKSVPISVGQQVKHHELLIEMGG